MAGRREDPTALRRRVRDRLVADHVDASQRQRSAGVVDAAAEGSAASRRATGDRESDQVGGGVPLIVSVVPTSSPSSVAFGLPFNVTLLET